MHPLGYTGLKSMGWRRAKMVMNFERLAIFTTACVLSVVTFSLSGCYAYPEVRCKMEMLKQRPQMATA